jgi:8-oxo-dGTP diphosphatase
VPDDTPIIVTAAVIERAGRFLVARRLEGTHLAGCWEFPGGKCEPGEKPEACLAREIREELDATARVGEEIFRTTYRYPDRSVELRFFRCALDGEPRPVMRQQIQWVSRTELGTLEFPPADWELIRLLTA